MTSYKVEQLPGPRTVLGEGPHWDIETQSLYYIDIYNNGSIHRYDYNENRDYRAEIENEDVVSFIIPVDGERDHFAVGIGRRVGIIKWNGRSTIAKIIRIAVEVENGPEFNDNRFNDAKADPTGRLYAGTMRLESKGDIFDARTGSFYVAAKDSPVRKLRSKIGCSNGLCWNEKTNKFYYVDSVDLDINEYDWDPLTGDIDYANGRKIIDFRESGETRPNFCADGMTIDNNGNLYVCTFGASKIFKIEPKSGKILLEIILPCEQITSAAFGGPNLDILYVTTAAVYGKNDPAGATFKVTGLDVTGTKMAKVRL